MEEKKGSFLKELITLLLIAFIIFGILYLAYALGSKSGFKKGINFGEDSLLEEIYSGVYKKGSVGIIAKGYNWRIVCERDYPSGVISSDSEPLNPNKTLIELSPGVVNE